MSFRLSTMGLALLLAVAPGAARAQSPAAASAPVSYASIAALDELLPKLEQNATVTATDLTRLKIEKWKVDGETRKQAQLNANSLVKNLQTALPGLIADLRAHPDELPANFKLYRNLTALYDVMAQVTELTGAFGVKGEYEALQGDFNTLEAIRRQLADRVGDLAEKQQAEMGNLRTQLAAAQAAVAAATPPPPVKKTVVDDNTPAAAAKPAKKPAPKAAKPKAPPSTPAPATPNPK